MTDNATLGIDGSNHQLPILEGSVGPDVVDIRKFYGETGMFTYDPGFTSTASCESAITFIDGEKGILLHRGYPIDQLARHSTFMEVAYLLVHGELPVGTELENFTYTISRHTMLHEQLANFYRGFRHDAREGVHGPRRVRAVQRLQAGRPRGDPQPHSSVSPQDPGVGTHGER